MNNKDLRQVGTIMGLPLYVDMSSVKDFEIKQQVLNSYFTTTERDRKFELIQIMLSNAFNFRKKS